MCVMCEVPIGLGVTRHTTPNSRYRVTHLWKAYYYPHVSPPQLPRDSLSVTGSQDSIRQEEENIHRIDPHVQGTGTQRKLLVFPELEYLMLDAEPWEPAARVEGREGGREAGSIY